MSRTPIGENPMTSAERQQRYRAKARAAREIEKASAITNHGSAAAAHDACIPPTAAPNLLAGGPEVIAQRIFDSVSRETATGIAVALQQRLQWHGSWPTWRAPIIS